MATTRRSIPRRTTSSIVAPAPRQRIPKPSPRGASPPVLSADVFAAMTAGELVTETIARQSRITVDFFAIGLALRELARPERYKDELGFGSFEDPRGAAPGQPRHGDESHHGGVHLPRAGREEARHREELRPRALRRDRGRAGRRRVIDGSWGVRVELPLGDVASLLAT
jgi:hypothetical protein